MESSGLGGIQRSQSFFQGVEGNLSAVGHVQLFDDAADVFADRPLGDDQGLANLVIGEPLGN